MKLLIKNGRIVNPATQMDAVADLVIEGGKVTQIAQEITGEFDQVVDASGQMVMPGFIDLHVHFRDPGLTHKEDIYTGMAAAARGGYTTVLCMPNTKPVADSAEVIRYVHDKAKTENGINVLQVGAITKGQAGVELADIEEMIAAGSPALSEDGKSVMNAQLYKEAMKIAAAHNIPILAHCEDINMVNGGCMNEDEASKALGQKGISNGVEDVIVARDILLAKETGARLHLCHCSTKDSVEMVRIAKEAGLPVSAEVCPHHFVLTSADIPKGGVDVDTNYKMNPPLRTREDVDALKAGLKAGIMEVISTDHAPHTAEEKNTSIQKAPFGIVGLETAACLTYSELVLGGIYSPMQMAAAMSYNPAKVMQMDKGDIQVGKDADLVIFDPTAVYKIEAKDCASKGKNTPFDGYEVTGKVTCTICGGRIVYQNN